MKTQDLSDSTVYYSCDWNRQMASTLGIQLKKVLKCEDKCKHKFTSSNFYWFTASCINYIYWKCPYESYGDSDKCYSRLRNLVVSASSVYTLCCTTFNYALLCGKLHHIWVWQQQQQTTPNCDVGWGQKCNRPFNLSTHRGQWNKAFPPYKA